MEYSPQVSPETLKNPARGSWSTEPLGHVALPLVTTQSVTSF